MIAACHYKIEDDLAIGFGVGLCVAATALSCIEVLHRTGAVHFEEENSEYQEMLDTAPETSIFILPIAEETVCHLLRHVTTRSILWIIPATAESLLSPELTVAATVATVSTAVFFGLAHLTNPHKNAPIQAVLHTGTGVVYGTLATQVSLPAAMVAHGTNNACVWALGIIAP